MRKILILDGQNSDRWGLYFIANLKMSSKTVEPHLRSPTADKSAGPSESVGQVLLNLARIPSVRVAAAIMVGLILCYWPLMATLPGLWFDKDSYYSHGLLVPLIAGYIIYSRREALKKIPVSGNNLALIPLAVLMYVAWVASRTSQAAFLSVLFVASILLCVWFLAGGRWVAALSAPVLYLLFGLPIWASTIDAYTNPLQQISTRTSFAMLRAVGMNPMQLDSTTIQLNQPTGIAIDNRVSGATSGYLYIGNSATSTSIGSAVQILKPLP